METSLQFLKTLGRDLSSNLSSLTINYKLGFGSFMDKTDIPFYNNDMIRQMYPDIKHEDGYLFRHRLNFTQDTIAFMKNVSRLLIYPRRSFLCSNLVTVSIF